MRKSKMVGLLTFAYLLQACSAYREPAGPPAIELEPVAANVHEAQAVSGVDWWQRFEDPVLTSIVEDALDRNGDVRVALANLDAARALQGLQRQEFLPTGGILATMERSTAPQTSGVAQSVQAGAVALWEPDIFGRIRGSARIADAGALGAHAERDAARLLVVAETIGAYFRFRAAGQREVELLRALAGQRDIVALTGVLVDESLVAGDSLDRALAELASDEIAVLGAREEMRILENRLAVLTGRQAGTWHVPESVGDPALRFVPASLDDFAFRLRERPDVRIAEQAVIARQAAAGIERAGYFPSLTVSGVVGFAAGSFGDLDARGTETWSLLPALAWNLLDFGRTGRRIAASEAQVAAAVAAYENTVLTAVEETENALTRYRTVQQQLAFRETARRHARSAADAAAARYEEGLGTYLDALVARRDAIAAELALVDAAAEQRVATAALFVAVGSPPGP